MDSTSPANIAPSIDKGVRLSLIGIEGLAGISVRFHGGHLVEIDGLGPRECYAGLCVIVGRDSEIAIYGAHPETFVKKSP